MRSVAPRDRLALKPERDVRPRRFAGLETRRFSHPSGPTLDARIAQTWSTLVECGTVQCPVCEKQLQAAQPCPGCGSELS
jgi:hypothetical protein